MFFLKTLRSRQKRASLHKVKNFSGFIETNIWSSCEIILEKQKTFGPSFILVPYVLTKL